MKDFPKVAARISFRCHCTSHSILAASKHVSTAKDKSFRIARIPSSAFALFFAYCSDASNKIADECVEPGKKIDLDDSATFCMNSNRSEDTTRKPSNSDSI